MKTYAKGVRAERELLHFLNYKEFSVCRIPASGGFLSPIDIIALKKGLILVFEIKAWAKKPKFEHKRLQRFKAWCEKAGAIGIFAWRTTGKWLFLRLEDAENNNYADENWIEMENLLRALDFG